MHKGEKAIDRLQRQRQTTHTKPNGRSNGNVLLPRLGLSVGAGSEARSFAETEPGSEATKAGASVLPGSGERFFKRCVDLTLALLLGIPALPVFVVLWVLIRLDSPGPGVYWCLRVGRGGRRFKCFKFRSMYQDADARLNEVLEAEPELQRQYAVYRKLRNDPRVTRVGKILRRSSLDEILQLWNVLKGEMSIVGPRPYDEIELSCMEGKEHIIQSVRPGMTGLWQVSGRSRTSFLERLALDVQYVQKRSLWLDLRIFLRTLPAVLSSDGAY